MPKDWRAVRIVAATLIIASWGEPGPGWGMQATRAEPAAHGELGAGGSNNVPPQEVCILAATNYDHVATPMATCPPRKRN